MTHKYTTRIMIVSGDGRSQLKIMNVAANTFRSDPLLLKGCRCWLVANVQIVAENVYRSH